jgi:dCTP deaminase
MILSNVDIQRALDDKRLVITPEPTPRFPTAGAADCPYQTSAVDLRLGEELSVYRSHRQPVIIDLRDGGFAKFGAAAMEPLRLTPDQPFLLQPRRFVLGRTHERVELPLHGTPDSSLAARVEGKSSYARCGMLVHFTAPTIHAGFEGTITLEIINLGEYAISLHPLMPICQLIIEEVRGVPFRNDSQFQGQSRTVG